MSPRVAWAAAIWYARGHRAIPSQNHGPVHGVSRIIHLPAKEEMPGSIPGVGTSKDSRGATWLWYQQRGKYGVAGMCTCPRLRTKPTPFTPLTCFQRTLRNSGDRVLVFETSGQRFESSRGDSRWSDRAGKLRLVPRTQRWGTHATPPSEMECGYRAGGLASSTGGFIPATLSFYHARRT